jgi:GTP-binding protein YchF
MKIAIVGLELAGKTTLFHALTRGQAAAGRSGRPGETLVAVVEVPDRRMDTLVAMFRPRKVSPASIEFVDGAGAAAPGGPRFGAAFLNDVRASDALVHVVRAFEDPTVPVDRPPDPLRDARTLETELILADLDLVEKRIERLEAGQRNRPKGAAGGGAAVEGDVLARLKDHLEAERPARAFARTAQEEEATRHLAFLSDKPAVIVANINESDIGTSVGALSPLQAHAEQAGAPLLDLCAKVEAEIALLPPEEEQSFLEAMGLAESGRYRLIRTVYNLLGLCSFFTVGEDEVKAWTIRTGDNAVTAAGKIHSDLARGFIRAEVIPYDALAEAGDPKKAKEAGKYRLEQKNYSVQDGDILNIRFSV